MIVDNTNSLIVKVKTCQESYKINDCLKCKHLLDCDLRDLYVSNVYKEMNPKMDNSGFEF